MSLKGEVEDKAVSTPPKLCVALRESIHDLRAAIKHQQKHTIAAALEALEKDRLKANKEQLIISRDQGPGYMPHLQQYVDALNDAITARSEALVAINRL